MKWIKKVAETPLASIAKVIDSLQQTANDRLNAPSIHAVRKGLHDVELTIPEVKDSLDEAAGDTINAPSIHAVRKGLNDLDGEIMDRVNADVEWLTSMVEGTSGASYTVTQSGTTHRTALNALFALVDVNKITPHSMLIVRGVVYTKYFVLYSKASDNSMIQYSYLDEVSGASGRILVGHFADIRSNGNTKYYYVKGDGGGEQDESELSATVGNVYAICY